MDSSTNMFGVPVQPTALPISAVHSATKNSEVTTTGKSPLKKIVLILVSIILFLGGLFFLYVAYLSLKEYGTGALIIPGVIGLILAGGGILIGISSIKKIAA